MDSRIREIEQWIAEAKHDLGECGREAYINKLYLLDAEIRAIIKEDGSLPAANSPRQQENNVRRFSLPNTAVAAAVAVLLLTASTVYFSSRYFDSNTITPSVSPAHRLAAVEESTSDITLAAYIPDNIPGEEILPNDWTPPVELEAPAVSTASTPVILAAATPSAEASPEGGISTQPAAAPIERAAPAIEHPYVPANVATEIALTPAARNTPQPAVAESDSNTNPTSSSLGGEVEFTVATEVLTEEPEEPITEDDHGFYDEWVVDNGDNSIEELVDELAEKELDLNSAELAEKLREGLDPRKDS